MIEGAQIFEKFLEDKGREQARKEYEDKIIQSAIKMLKKGYPIEDIVDFTGLSEDEINKLKESLTTES